MGFLWSLLAGADAVLAQVKIDGLNEGEEAVLEIRR